MKLDRQFAIGALNLLIGSASFNAQHFIVIAFLSSHFLNPTLTHAHSPGRSIDIEPNESTSRRSSRATLLDHWKQPLLQAAANGPLIGNRAGPGALQFLREIDHSAHERLLRARLGRTFSLQPRSV